MALFSRKCQDFLLGKYDSTGVQVHVAQYDRLLKKCAKYRVHQGTVALLSALMGLETSIAEAEAKYQQWSRQSATSIGGDELGAAVATMNLEGAQLRGSGAKFDCRNVTELFWRIAGALATGEMPVEMRNDNPLDISGYIGALDTLPSIPEWTTQTQVDCRWIAAILTLSGCRTL